MLTVLKTINMKKWFFSTIWSWIIDSLWWKKKKLNFNRRNVKEEKNKKIIETQQNTSNDFFLRFNLINFFILLNLKFFFLIQKKEVKFQSWKLSEIMSITVRIWLDMEPLLLFLRGDTERYVLVLKIGCKFIQNRRVDELLY